MDFFHIQGLESPQKERSVLESPFILFGMLLKVLKLAFVKMSVEYRGSVEL